MSNTIIGYKDQRTFGGISSNNIQPGSTSLANDSDVRISDPTTGQVLTFNGTDWVNESPTGGTLASLTDIDFTTEETGYVLSATPSGGKPFSFIAPGGGSTLESLTDVEITSVSNGQALAWDSAISKWVNGGTLEGLTDIAITSVSNGQALAWNSSLSKWTNQTISPPTFTAYFSVSTDDTLEDVQTDDTGEVVLIKTTIDGVIV